MSRFDQNWQKASFDSFNLLDNFSRRICGTLVVMILFYVNPRANPRVFSSEFPHVWICEQFLIMLTTFMTYIHIKCLFVCVFFSEFVCEWVVFFFYKRSRYVSVRVMCIHKVQFYYYFCWVDWMEEAIILTFFIKFNASSCLISTNSVHSIENQIKTNHKLE